MGKVALITGSARRIGAACAAELHAEGFNILLHYQHSEHDALRLAEQLTQRRANSVCLIKADLAIVSEIKRLAASALEAWGRLDVLVNNASCFQSVSFEQIQEADWDAAIASNLKAPLFLSQALAPALSLANGCIVNIADIHAARGLADYLSYSVSKAGLVAMTYCLAKELAPRVRVNAISPGAILWPDQQPDELRQAEILQKIPLRRCGTLGEIARTLRFLVCDATYITGQNLAVDGGRLLFS